MLGWKNYLPTYVKYQLAKKKVFNNLTIRFQIQCRNFLYFENTMTTKKFLIIFLASTLCPVITHKKECYILTPSVAYRYKIQRLFEAIYIFCL